MEAGQSTRGLMTLFKRGKSTDAASRRTPFASLPCDEPGSSADPQSTTPTDDQPPPPAPPLGWYPDPDNPAALRFWNGDLWDAADGPGRFADTNHLADASTPDRLSSPAEATGRGGAPWAVSPRALVAAAALTTACTAGAVALLSPQPTPSRCPPLSAVPRHAATPEAGRSPSECSLPEHPSGQDGVDPVGPHGPYGPYGRYPTIAEFRPPDPGV